MQILCVVPDKVLYLDVHRKKEISLFQIYMKLDTEHVLQINAR